MAAQWSIVPQGQRLTVELSPGGTGFVNVWEITFRVTDGPASGTTSSVRIPAEQYNAESVKAAIDALVGHMNAVAGL